MPDLALYEPDIALNVGATMRLAVCMDVSLHIIEPCGFPWSEAKMRRAGMDYMDQVRLHRHDNWTNFESARSARRIVLLTTKAALPYTDFLFNKSDILLAGRESAGVTAAIHESVQARIFIPIAHGARSMNVVNALSMVLGEALRQTRS